MVLPRALFCLLLSAAGSLAATDLTPHVKEVSSEGFTYQHVTVKLGDRTATFIAPLGWTVRGGADAIRMTPTKTSFAEGSIQAKPLPAPGFDEPTVAALVQTALAGAPPASQDAKVFSQQENAVVFGNSASYEVTISYKTLGETFCRSFTVVNLEDTQLVFVLSAKKADFDKTNDAFRRSITSWTFSSQKAADAQQPANAVSAVPAAH